MHCKPRSTTAGRDWSSGSSSGSELRAAPDHRVPGERRSDTPFPLSSSTPKTAYDYQCLLLAGHRHRFLVGRTRFDSLQVREDVRVRAEIVIEEEPHRR